MVFSILRNIYRIDTLLSCWEHRSRPSSTTQYSVVFWVLIACGDSKTSRSGNNTSNLEDKEKAEKFESHTNTLHVSLITLLLIHQLSLSCQNWFIITNVKVVKTCVKFIWIILLNHKTGNRCCLMNSEVTQNTAILLAIKVWFLQFLLAQTVHKSLFPLLSPVMANRWNHSDDTYSRFRGFFFKKKKIYRKLL